MQAAAFQQCLDVLHVHLVIRRTKSRALLWQVLAYITELQPSTSPQEQGELLA